MFVLLPQSVSSKYFSIFLNNGTFSIWGLPNLFFFNSFKIGVTPSSFLIIKLERPGSVRKCDDCLIFSVNECFTLSILADLLVLMKLAAEHTITTIFSTEKKRNIFFGVSFSLEHSVQKGGVLTLPKIARRVGIKNFG